MLYRVIALDPEWFSGEDEPPPAPEATVSKRGVAAQVAEMLGEKTTMIIVQRQT